MYMYIRVANFFCYFVMIRFRRCNYGRFRDPGDRKEKTLSKAL